MKIDELIKQTFAEKNKAKQNAYKNVKAELQKVLTAKNAPEYSEEVFIKTVSKYMKSLTDAIEQFESAGRSDLAREYSEELEIIKELVPAPATPTEIMQALWSYGSREGYMTEMVPGNPSAFTKPAIPKKEMGKLIKELKQQFPTTDGDTLTKTVQAYLV